VVHGDDLDIATHGRGFWVLDQMSALRQIAEKGSEIASEQAYLFKPGESWAIHQGGQDGTPLPHEEPQELDPPGGVLAYYWLKSAPGSPVKLELVDSGGKVAVCAASDAPVHPVDTEAINVQAYWEEPAPPPSAEAGMHRFSLNLSASRGVKAASPGANRLLLLSMLAIRRERLHLALKAAPWVSAVEHPRLNQASIRCA
jgi:hypothetical protein